MIRALLRRLFARPAPAPAPSLDRLGTAAPHVSRETACKVMALSIARATMWR